MESEKTHRDYVDSIGGTHATARSYVEKRWNQYYFKTYIHIVNSMIGDVRSGIAFDVGTSHGNWFRFLKKKGFDAIFGVELDYERAQLAKKLGYTEVYNCDAVNIPHPSNSVDVVVSNDVFVHILKLEDKIAVCREIERILKPSGIFIVNHTMSAAFKLNDYQIIKNCSFLSLHNFIKILLNNTNFELVDIKPTYYNFRKSQGNFFEKILRRFIALPFSVTLLYFSDFFNTRKLPLDDSDTVYIKLKKKNNV